MRTSKRRVLRLMGEHGLLAPSRVGSPRGPRSHDGTIISAAADVMWGTDLTTTITGEDQAAVFAAIDHCSAECVGIHTARHANRPRAGGQRLRSGRSSAPTIRTLKENLLWAQTFATVEDLRQALLEFRETYNATWLIERHGFRPPSAVRQDQLSTAALAA